MDQPGGARDRLLGMVVLSSITFLVLSITPPLRFLVGFVSNAIFAGIVGFQLAELMDRRYRQEVRLKHPTVFVSGCDSGLGLHTARRLHEHGFEVYAGCLDPGSDGATVLKEMRVNVVALDYMEEDSIVQAYKTVAAQLGDKELWGIVANAGVTNYGELEWMSYDELRWLVAVNVTGTMRFVKEGIALLRKSKGRIVIMSSVHGRMSIPGSVGTSAAAAALCSLADGLRRELYKWQVNVSTVEPMLYKTRITDPENVKIGINEVINRMSPTMKEEYGQLYLDTFKNMIPKRIQKYMHVNLNDVSKAVHCALTDPIPKARYRCGSTDLALCSLFELLPIEMLDSVLINAFQPRTKARGQLMVPPKPSVDLSKTQ
ncbi:dehydrogenase/reductase SDR family member 9-like [Dermacentor andersoni]|uniref:dehydrogenase/reductase SDR family member 9-like n=1 Tax=Dermacentor andersoni TaxID=34620 RepID=UPI0021551351|nr:dehydrogenase/reductase SDR family member 9-like [Dermacentor andersoni]